MDSKLKSSLNSFAELAAERGEFLVLVGGYVRDQYLAATKSPQTRDIDLLYTGDAIEFAAGLADVKIKEFFKPFRTVKIEVAGLEEYEIEIASTRIESYFEPASFPQVTLCNEKNRSERIRRDLPRRDFTINALISPLRNTDLERITLELNQNTANPIATQVLANDMIVIDLVNAFEDFAKQEIKIFHDNSFIDDPTRIYRALRFAAKLGFKFEKNTYEMMRAACRDTSFPDWYKKRKNRFNIELDLIESLEPAKAKIAKDLLEELTGLK